MINLTLFHRSKQTLKPSKGGYKMKNQKMKMICLVILGLSITAPGIAAELQCYPETATKEVDLKILKEPTEGKLKDASGFRPYVAQKLGSTNIAYIEFQTKNYRISAGAERVKFGPFTVRTGIKTISVTNKNTGARATSSIQRNRSASSHDTAKVKWATERLQNIEAGRDFTVRCRIE